MSVDLVKRIAEGEEFDIAEGLREIAKELVAGRSTAAAGKSVKDVPATTSRPPQADLRSEAAAIEAKPKGK